MQAFKDNLKGRYIEHNNELLLPMENHIWELNDMSVIYINTNYQICINGKSKQEPVGIKQNFVYHLTPDGQIKEEPTKDSIPISVLHNQTIQNGKIIPWAFETTVESETLTLPDGYTKTEPWCQVLLIKHPIKEEITPPMKNEIFFAKVKENAIIPTKEPENAGYDIYACFDDPYKIILPHETQLIPTGIACALHPKWYFQVEERGSTGSKGIKKSAGVVDAGYRGEIFIAITNSTNKNLIITKNPQNTEYLKDIPAEHRENGNITYPYQKAIAQLVLHEVPVMNIKEIPYEKLLNIKSNRMTGSLGSTNA